MTLFSEHVNPTFWDVTLDKTLDTFAMVIFWLFLVIIVFTFIDRYFNDSITKFLSGNYRKQPLLGTVLGIIPGCGGGLFVFNLYKAQKVHLSSVVSSMFTSVGALSLYLIVSQWEIFLIALSIQVALSLIVGYGIQFSGKDKLIDFNDINQKKEEKYKNLPNIYNLFEKIILPIFVLLFILAFSFVGIIFSFVPNGEEIFEDKLAIKYMMLIFFIVISLWTLFRKILIRKKYNFSAVYNFENERLNKISISFNNYFYSSVVELINIATIVWLTSLLFGYLIKLTGFQEAFEKFVSSQNSVAILIVVAAFASLVPSCGFQIAFATSLLAAFGFDSQVVANTNDYFWYIAIPLITQSIVTVGDLSLPIFIQSPKTWLKLNSINLSTGLIIGYSIFGIVSASGGF